MMLGLALMGFKDIPLSDKVFLMRDERKKTLTISSTQCQRLAYLENYFRKNSKLVKETFLLESSFVFSTLKALRKAERN